MGDYQSSWGARVAKGENDWGSLIKVIEIDIIC